MAYFNELPNLDIESRLADRSSTEDYIRIKNIWKRARIREDLINSISAFSYYDIKDGERPDQIAEKLYGDPELDWVILISNNIINVNEQWPIDNNSLYKYLMDKYGREEELQKIHHIETVEQKESYNRLVVPSGLIVDLSTTESIKTETNKSKYTLESYPIIDADNKISVNLVQYMKLGVRDKVIQNIQIKLIDNQEDITNLSVYGRNGSTYNVEIKNDLENNWPSSWGGKLIVNGRSDMIEIQIDEEIYNDTFIRIGNKLFSIYTDLETDSPTIELAYTVYENYVPNPRPNMTIKIERSGFNTPILNQERQEVINFKNTNIVTNYEYEVKKNEDKRRILILRPEFLGLFISDLRNIMRYDKSTQYIDQTNRRV